MRKGLFAQSPGWFKLAFTLTAIFASLVITSVFGFIGALLIFKIKTLELLMWLSNLNAVKNINVLKYLQIIQSIGIFILPGFILSWLYAEQNKNYYGFNHIPSLHLIMWVGLCILFSVPVINLMAELNSRLNLPDSLSRLEIWIKQMEETASKLTLMFLEMPSWQDFLINLLMIGILPALGEEMIFRGVLQKSLIQMTRHPHTGIILSSLIFAFIHLQFYGFVPRFALGVFFGYLYYWTDTLWLPVAAHFINNAGAVIFFYFAGKDTVNQKIETLGTPGNSMMLAFSGALILVILIRRIYIHTKKMEPRQ